MAIVVFRRFIALVNKITVVKQVIKSSQVYES